MDQYLLGKVIYSTESLPVLPESVEPDDSEFNGYVAPDEHTAPAAVITIPAQQPTQPKTLPRRAPVIDNPADALDAPNPEAGFVAPAEPLPRSGDAADRTPPDDESPNRP